jgi:RNA polymerase sigma-70 factor (ECF subfamily)
LDELQLCLPAQDMEGQILDRVVLREVIHSFLAGLRPQHRKIFLQRYWYLCSVREIAEDLAITESKVTVTLHRTRQKLAKRLEQEGLL